MHRINFLQYDNTEIRECLTLTAFNLTMGASVGATSYVLIANGYSFCVKIFETASETTADDEDENLEEESPE